MTTTLRDYDNSCTHAGSIGDILAACVALKQIGSVSLYLNTKGPLDWRQSPERLASLKTLLEVQPYFTQVELSEEVVGKNLDEWRNHWHNDYNLSDMVCSWLGLPHANRAEPWLSVEPLLKAPVIIHRSPRYHNASFPWRTIVEKYGSDVLFVGNEPYEHADFCQRFGAVSYWHSKDYKQTASLIAGSVLFIGNQSSPQWVAEGLKVPKILESVPRGGWSWNCNWERPGCQNVEDGKVELPDL